MSHVGELYKLDNRVVGIYTFFHFVFRFLLIGLFFFIRDTIQDIPPISLASTRQHSKSFEEK